MNVLTWHVHGSYLASLTRVPFDWFLPVRPGRPESYGGRSAGFDWGDNVHEVAAEDVRDLQLDAILYQARRNWETDQFDLLTEAQRALPRLYLEHDPPRESPTDTRHPVDDRDVLLVHVTPFNDLMWDSGRTPTRVIEHGVPAPEIEPTYELDRGIAVVNNICRRGRRLGADVFEEARAAGVPIDLVGMGSAEAGGLGEIPLAALPEFEASYRFFFNPIRYTSLGLAVCEAMSLGLPMVGLATTEMATVVENRVTGFVDTDPAVLVERMRELLGDRGLARRLGAAARAYARARFGMERFVRDWEAAISEVVAGPAASATGPAASAASLARPSIASSSVVPPSIARRTR